MAPHLCRLLLAMACSLLALWVWTAHPRGWGLRCRTHEAHTEGGFPKGTLQLLLSDTPGMFTAQSCCLLVSQQWVPGRSMHEGRPVAVYPHGHILRQFETNSFLAPFFATGQIFVYSLKVKNFKSPSFL